MLEDEPRRPTAAKLLTSPIVRFYRYLVDESEPSIQDVANTEEALPAFLSGIKIANKNRAVIPFLALMNMYPKREELCL